MTEFPKLRWPIELKMEKIGEEEVFLVRCPLGVSPQPLLLLPGAAPIISCFDGRTSLPDIVKKFEPYGVGLDIIKELVHLMDSYLFLDNDNFKEADRRMREAFRALEVRQAALAGLSYPADAASLEQQIDGYLQHGRADAGTRRLAALVAPHIDYRRGGPCYGIAYSRLVRQEPDLIIVLGIAHMYSESLFHLTRKHFACPLGDQNCSFDFVDRLAARYGLERSFADEVLHRSEHSIELQIPFISRICRRACIVPILTGGFYEILRSGGRPADFAAYDDFAGALAECIHQETAAGKKVCLLAAVDMAHVGKSFGDNKPLSPEWMQRVEARDRVYLDAVVTQNKDMLFAHVAEDGDARRICGFPAVYTMLDVMERLNLNCSGELLDYRQAVDYLSECAVTMAGAALWE